MPLYITNLFGHYSDWEEQFCDFWVDIPSKRHSHRTTLRICRLDCLLRRQTSAFLLSIGFFIPQTIPVLCPPSWANFHLSPNQRPMSWKTDNNRWLRHHVDIPSESSPFTDLLISPLSSTFTFLPMFKVLSLRKAPTEHYYPNQCLASFFQTIIPFPSLFPSTGWTYVAAKWLSVPKPHLFFNISPLDSVMNHLTILKLSYHYMT